MAADIAELDERWRAAMARAKAALVAEGGDGRGAMAPFEIATSFHRSEELRKRATALFWC